MRLVTESTMVTSSLKAGTIIVSGLVEPLSSIRSRSSTKCPATLRRTCRAESAISKRV